jgi:hypothetical protein
MSNKKRKFDEQSISIINDKEDSAEELIQLKLDKQRKMYDYERRIKKIKEDIRDLEKKIYNKCDHNWERDYSYAGLYTKAETVCTKCNLYKDYNYYFSR